MVLDLILWNEPSIQPESGWLLSLLDVTIAQVENPVIIVAHRDHSWDSGNAYNIF